MDTNPNSVPASQNQIVLVDSQLDSFDDPALTEPQQQTETLPELPADWLKFCENYLQDFNNTRAYLTVYPDSTRAAAYVSAFELLRKPRVSEYIRIRRTELEKNFKDRLWSMRERILQEYERLSFSDIRKFVEQGDSGVAAWKSWNELPDGATAAIQEITLDKGNWIRKVKFYSKTEALQNLATMAGMLSEEIKTQLNVQINVRHLY